tara:strand:+ start:105 stop:389 length:285 start_codon:yes stop_codon:yes gene_type:complete
MTHKEKDVLVGNLVDKNVALKKRVDFLEGKNYDETIEDLTLEIELVNDVTVELQMAMDNNAIFIQSLLIDIRDLYKRIDSKNEDIQILNTLLNK